MCPTVPGRSGRFTPSELATAFEPPAPTPDRWRAQTYECQTKLPWGSIWTHVWPFERNSGEQSNNGVAHWHFLTPEPTDTS